MLELNEWTCFLQEHSHITSKSLEYFYSSKPEPHQFSIIVRGIPVAQGSTLDDTVQNFYEEYHPSTYLSHEMVHRTSRLESLIVRAVYYLFLFMTCFMGLWLKASAFTI